MKMKSYQHRKIELNFSQILILIMLLIIINSIFLLSKFNKNITPKLLGIAESSINKLNETILTNYRVKDIFPQVDLENAIILTKNSKEEIISVDFNLENIYKSLSILTEYLQNSVNDLKVREDILKNYDKYLSSKLNSIILKIPIGILSDGIYNTNLGPKIPVKIEFMGYVASSVRIKLENYGINNVLISIYIDCYVTNEFIIPFTSKEINHEYNILVASKIIQGVVPEYYGGAMEAKSNILNIPIN